MKSPSEGDNRYISLLGALALSFGYAVGVFFFFFYALSQHKGGLAAMSPAFSDGVSPIMQISRILALMP